MSPGQERAPTGTPQGLSNISADKTDDAREFTSRPGQERSLPLGTTQREKVVWLLLSSEAVCSTTFLEEYIPRSAAVIHKLRRAGYLIVSQPCGQKHDHTSPQIEYCLLGLPTDPKSDAAADRPTGHG